MRSKATNEARYYYDVLGVSPSDSLESVTASYKRLAKKYHPDTSPLPKDEAEEKFKAITEAYRFVRQAKAEIQGTELYYGPSQAGGPTPAPASSQDRNEDDWAIICERNPKARLLYEDLGRISLRLAEEFRTVVACTPYCEELEEIAAILEDEYITKYFGHHRGIRLFAKWLLANNHTKAASELNAEIIKGVELKDSDKLIERITRTHGLPYIRPEASQFSDGDSIDYVLNMTRKIGFWGICLSASIVASFVSGVITSSLLFGAHVERGVLAVLLEIFVICILVLVGMLSIRA